MVFLQQEKNLLEKLSEYLYHIGLRSQGLQFLFLIFFLSGSFRENQVKLFHSCTRVLNLRMSTTYEGFADAKTT